MQVKGFASKKELARGDDELGLLEPEHPGKKKTDLTFFERNTTASSRRYIAVNPAGLNKSSCTFEPEAVQKFVTHLDFEKIKTVQNDHLLLR